MWTIRAWGVGWGGDGERIRAPGTRSQGSSERATLSLSQQAWWGPRGLQSPGGRRSRTTRLTRGWWLLPPKVPYTRKSPDTPGSLEGNTEGPGTASSEPLLPS